MIMILSFLLLGAVERILYFMPNNEYVSVIPKIYPQVDVAKIEKMIKKEAPEINDLVINKMLTAVQCTANYNINHSNILTLIDYSLPSNQKRLWIFDLQQNKLLFNTYVAHGIKSGTLLTNNFSNKYNSKASSIGIYLTDQAYYGREGLSLRLEGLDRSFNDNARNRSIVMHGGWYLDENFIQHYGRPGRSWGCPAVPLAWYRDIINTIKEKSLLVVYYPKEDWFNKSKYLTCVPRQSSSNANLALSPAISPEPPRDEVYFAQVAKGGEDKPILVMAAKHYERIFQMTAPLSRMLRRQIAQEEYIALNKQEIEKIIKDNNSQVLNTLNFVIPTLRQVRGYYETEMKIVNLGIIKGITALNDQGKAYSISLNNNAKIQVKATDRFIRWLGL